MTPLTSPCDIPHSAETMADPCKHSEAEHRVVNVCEELIHYPSEDYPCSCPGFARGDNADVCLHCEHPKARHTTVRMCRPASGEFCACRAVIG